MHELKTYCFDLDNTLCNTSGTDYFNSTPIPMRIRKVNQLYAVGHKIVIFTARGSKSGVDFSELTERQLKEWGVDFHDLLLGKPFADVYVDDKGINSEHFLWES